MTIHVVHATAPGCHWSWGYEAVLHRLRMVYGDQIELTVRLGCPYEDWQQWLRDYEMSEEEASRWVNEEMAPMMGVPLARVAPGKMPPTVLPPTLAVLAAVRFAPDRAERLHRALLRMYAVEGVDTSRWSAIEAAAREAGVDAARLRREMEDEEGLREDLANEAGKGPPAHVGFYNWLVWDGENRRVVLDYAFEPRILEGAIDYLSDARLRKERPTDVLAYLRANGWAPLAELRRAFDLGEDEAQAALDRLEKEGRAERGILAGAPHWRATA